MLALQNAIEPATNTLVARARAADPRLDQAVRNNKPATAGESLERVTLSGG